MSAFDSASKALFTTLRQAAGVKVTYTQAASGSTCSLTAVRGRTQFSQVNDRTGETTFMETNDFLIKSKDLRISGSVVTPTRGDRIAYDGVTYTVLSDGSDAMFKYTDQSRQTMRIHCKEVG